MDDVYQGIKQGLLHYSDVLEKQRGGGKLRRLMMLTMAGKLLAGWTLLEGSNRRDTVMEREKVDDFSAGLGIAKKQEGKQTEHIVLLQCK